MTKFKSFFSLLVCAFLSMSILQAQNVDEIVDTYLENIGGAENWKKVKDMKVTGDATMQGMTFPFVRTATEADLFKMEINVMGKTIVQAYDGETAWHIEPFQGGDTPQKMNEEEAKEMKKEKFEDELIDYKRKGHTLTLEGSEEIDGTETYKLKMVKKNGDEMFYFFDKDDNVPIMMRSFAESGPMKGQPVEMYVSDYQEVDGLYMPFSMTQKANGQTFMTMNLKKVEFNTAMDKASFVYPNKKEAPAMEKKN